MKFEMSEENSKRVLSGTKWITNVGQNYLTSLNNSTKPTSSEKINQCFFTCSNHRAYCYNSIIS